MKTHLHWLAIGLLTFSFTAQAEEVYRDNTVRFTLIDEGTIRLEYAPDGKFVDNKSFVAVIREYGDVPHKASTSGGKVVITTSKFKLTYKKDGAPLSAKNLTITSDKTLDKQFTWTPGTEQKGNLKGTYRTLDGYDGDTYQYSNPKHPMPLEDGLLATDGCDVRIPLNPEDTETFFPGSNGQKPFNITKISALFDIMSRIYEDALVEGKAVANENKMLVKMIQRSNIQNPVILLGDRNFECWDNMAQLQRKGWNYVIRVKEQKGIASGLNFPNTEEFDMWVNLSLTRKQSKAVKALLIDRNHYRYIPSCVRCDPLDESGELFYTLHFRVVRFRLDTGAFEVLITNLDPEKFPPDELKRLYAMRWGIETSFRELKYTVGLRYFHAKKADSIRQEIFARLVMYNFCERITARALIKMDDCKHDYMANFTRAVHLCKALFLGKADPDGIELLICRHLSPVRPGRRNPRNLRQQEVVYFLYRAA